MMQLDLISLLPGQKQMEKHREVIMHKNITPDKNQISHISKTTQRNQSTQLSNQDILNQSYFKTT